MCGNANLICKLLYYHKEIKREWAEVYPDTQEKHLREVNVHDAGYI